MGRTGACLFFLGGGVLFWGKAPRVARRLARTFRETGFALQPPPQSDAARGEGVLFFLGRGRAFLRKSPPRGATPRADFPRNRVCPPTAAPKRCGTGRGRPFALGKRIYLGAPVRLGRGCAFFLGRGRAFFLLAGRAAKNRHVFAKKQWYFKRKYDIIYAVWAPLCRPPWVAPLRAARLG